MNNRRHRIKTIVCIILCFAMILPFWGCKKEDPAQKEPSVTVADLPETIAQPTETVAQPTETSEPQESEKTTTALVTDAYTKSCTYTAKMYNYETGETEDKEITCTYRIPQINLYSNAVEQINSEIYNALYPVVKDAVNEIEEYGSPYTSDEVSYRWATNGNVLSLVILNNSAPDYGGGKEYLVYNIDLVAEEKMTDESLILEAGFSETTYRERAREVLGSSFWSGWDPADENFQSQHFVSFFNEQLKKTISDKNIRQSHPYLNENGQLCIIAQVYSLAGADCYWNDLNMIVFEKLPYYADQVQAQPEPTEEPEPDPTDPPAAETGGITVEELLGEWVVDTDYTKNVTGMSMWDMYGSSFSDGGNKMTFRSDGSCQYYVAWCYGNGSFALQNGEIVLNLSDGDPLTGTVRLKITKDGVLRIGLDQYGDGNLVFWRKA